MRLQTTGPDSACLNIPLRWMLQQRYNGCTTQNFEDRTCISRTFADIDEIAQEVVDVRFIP